MGFSKCYFQKRGIIWEYFGIKESFFYNLLTFIQNE